MALTLAAAIGDPARFRSSRLVGAHFGLTPTRSQSGETDVTGRISKVGDAGVRVALYEAANVILTRPPGEGLGSEGLGARDREARRDEEGQGRARPQARARGRAAQVVLHRMLTTGECCSPTGRVASAPAA